MTIQETLDAIKRGELTVGEALELERESEDPRSTLIQKLEGMLEPQEEAAVADQKKDTIKVRTNPKKIRGRGAFTDPDTKATIGREAVTVERTAFVRQKLLSEELVEA